MSNFLSQLTASERARLLEELNYMNLEEIRGFCSVRGIPYRIMAESADGKLKASKDTDRNLRRHAGFTARAVDNPLNVHSPQLPAESHGASSSQEPF